MMRDARRKDSRSTAAVEWTAEDDRRPKDKRPGGRYSSENYFFLFNKYKRVYSSSKPWDHLMAATGSTDLVQELFWDDSIVF